MRQMKYASRSLLSFVSFNLGWWVCALGPRYQMDWIGPASMPLWLGLHLYFVPKPTRLGEGLFLVLIGLLGFFIDTVLIYLGVFSISPEVIMTPAWLVCMWVLLGLTFESMLAIRKSLILVCFMGVLSGPLSYLFAQAVNILRYQDPAWLNMALHCALWAVLMPLLFALRDFTILRTLKHQP
jgi:hypothetical protein